MASPLHLQGGFQLTQQNGATSAALRWRSSAPCFIPETGFDPPAGYPLHFFPTAPSLILESSYSQHVALALGGASFVVTPTGAPPAYDATRMFLMF